MHCSLQCVIYVWRCPRLFFFEYQFLNEPWFQRLLHLMFRQPRQSLVWINAFASWRIRRMPGHKSRFCCIFPLRYTFLKKSLRYTGGKGNGRSCLIGFITCLLVPFLPNVAVKWLKWESNQDTLMSWRSGNTYGLLRDCRILSKADADLTKETAEVSRIGVLIGFLQGCLLGLKVKGCRMPSVRSS